MCSATACRASLVGAKVGGNGRKTGVTDGTVRRSRRHTTRGTMATLTPKQEELCQQSRWDYSDLRALFISCTLKRSPEVSHTEGLADTSMEIMRRQGVTVDLIRAVDHDIATGVWPDMTEHGWERDDWPAIFEQVEAANILVLHPGDRAPLRQLPPAQRRRPIPVLRPGGRLSGHRQRGRREALRHERPLFTPTP